MSRMPCLPGLHRIPLPAGADGFIALNGRFALGSDWKRERLGVAVFVEHQVTGRVLQAASATGCL
ncbi:MAG TPA: hypothetical protein VFU53_01610 [Burkholderiales bacterium]|nr:hypothetical protein [Burkholderiales bacterium]